MRAHRQTLRHVDCVVTLDNILDGDDGVGALRHHAARRDRHRLAGAERTRRGPARRDLTDEAKRAGNICRPHREAVHGGARKRREVDERVRRLRGHSSRRVPDGHRLAGQRPSTAEHERLRLLVGE